MQLFVDVALQTELLNTLDIARPRAVADTVEHMNDVGVIGVRPP